MKYFNNLSVPTGLLWHSCLPKIDSPRTFYHLGGNCQLVRVSMATNTAMETFLPILIEMMRNPPDPNKPLPLSNRLEVAVGVSVPFLVCALYPLTFSTVALTTVDA